MTGNAPHVPRPCLRKIDLTILTTSFLTALGSGAKKLDEDSLGVRIWLLQ